MAEIAPETFTALAALLESGWRITKLSGWSPDAAKMEIKIVCERK